MNLRPGSPRNFLVCHSRRLRVLRLALGDAFASLFGGGTAAVIHSEPRTPRIHIAGARFFSAFSFAGELQCGPAALGFLHPPPLEKWRRTEAKRKWFLAKPLKPIMLSLSASGGLTMPTPTNLFLVRAIKDLEKLQSEAERQGDKRLASFIFILYSAIREVREIQRSSGQ